MFKKALLISAFLLIPLLGFSQSQDSTFSFTSTEIDSLYSKVRTLQINDSLKTIKLRQQQQLVTQLRTKISQYEDLNSLQESKIDLLDKRIELKTEKNDLLQKKINRNRFKHILIGSGAGILLGVLIAQ